MSDRFSRQRGLLRQPVVETLRVRLETDSMPEPFVEAMECLAEHLGVRHLSREVGGKEEGFTVVWDAYDNTVTNQKILSIAYGSNGVFLNGENAGDLLDPVYEPAVATIAGCLVWSEILRRAGAFFPVELPKVSVSVNVRVNPNSLYVNMKSLAFSLQGHDVVPSIRPTDDGSMHQRVLLRLADEDPLVRQLVERLHVEAVGAEIEPRTPQLPIHLPPLAPHLSGHLTLVGAGGLGTWCMHTLVEGLKKAEHADLTLLVFDKDMEVEAHNLNRQVIYNQADLGMSKIAATRRWLEACLPSAKVMTAYELIDAMAKEPEDESIDGLDLDELLAELEEGFEIENSNHVLSINEVVEQLNATDLVIGCLDAMRPRVLANLIAAQRGLPYINGGVANFSGEYSQFTSQSLVSKYGAEVTNDVKVMSCQEDGAVPLSSMVLTNAFVGAFQALAALQRMSGYSTACMDYVCWNAYENHLIVIDEAGNLQQSACPDIISDALWPREVNAA